MIELTLVKAFWINGNEDDPKDQCAHGYIRFIINNLQITNEDEEWTVSAAALFLLRTINNDHTANHPVAEDNYLIPCCGFNSWKHDGNYPILIMGCNHGIDPEVIHEKDRVHIRLKNKTTSISLTDWTQAVLSFANQVSDFYSISSPKEKPYDKNDQEGWDLFWQEWNKRIATTKQMLFDLDCQGNT